MYLLQVRQLRRSRIKSKKALKGAIAILLFNAECESEEEWKAFHRQIKDELAE